MTEKKILIVEADGALSEEWANGLRDYGFKVAVTADGDDGLSKAEKAAPDLVMLRVELPTVNGYKIAKKLKENEQLKDVPLLLLSSEASEKDFEAHKKTKSRAQGYRKVPVEFDDLLEEIENLVGLPAPAIANFQAEAVPAEKFNEMEAKRSELLLEVDRIKEQLESKIQSEARLEHRVQELERDMVSKAGAEAEGLAAEIGSLRAELEAIKTERDEARSEVDSKKRIVNKLKENITGFEQKIGETGTKSGELEAKVGELNAKIAELNGKVAELSTRPMVDLGPKVAQLEEELGDTKSEVESKKKVIGKLKENIEKLEAAQSNNEFIEAAQKEKADAQRELEDARGDVEAKKKVISTLKNKIESLEKEEARLTADNARITEERKTELETLAEERKSEAEELESKKKVAAKLKERVETLEADLAQAKKEREENESKLTRTIANITVGLNDAKEKQAQAEEDREKAIEAKATSEKGHQKELDGLKNFYEPKVAALKAAEKELDAAKENIRQLDRKLDEESRKNRERDDEYADKIAEMKRTQQKEMQDYVRREDELKKQLEALGAENKKNEERVVKAFKKLKAHEAQVERVQKALEIAMTISKGDAGAAANGKPKKTLPEPE